MTRAMTRALTRRKCQSALDAIMLLLQCDDLQPGDDVRKLDAACDQIRAIQNRITR